MLSIVSYRKDQRLGLMRTMERRTDEISAEDAHDSAEGLTVEVRHRSVEESMNGLLVEPLRREVRVERQSDAEREGEQLSRACVNDNLGAWMTVKEYIQLVECRTLRKSPYKKGWPRSSDSLATKPVAGASESFDHLENEIILTIQYEPTT